MIYACTDEAYARHEHQVELKGLSKDSCHKQRTHTAFSAIYWSESSHQSWFAFSVLLMADTSEGHYVGCAFSHLMTMLLLLTDHANGVTHWTFWTSNSHKDSQMVYQAILLCYHLRLRMWLSQLVVSKQPYKAATNMRHNHTKHRNHRLKILITDSKEQRMRNWEQFMRKYDVHRNADKQRAKAQNSARLIISNNHNNQLIFSKWARYPCRFAASVSIATEIYTQHMQYKNNSTWKRVGLLLVCFA